LEEKMNFMSWPPYAPKIKVKMNKVYGAYTSDDYVKLTFDADMNFDEIINFWKGIGVEMRVLRLWYAGLEKMDSYSIFSQNHHEPRFESYDIYAVPHYGQWNTITVKRVTGMRFIVEQVWVDIGDWTFSPPAYLCDVYIPAKNEMPTEYSELQFQQKAVSPSLLPLALIGLSSLAIGGLYYFSKRLKKL